MSATRSDVMTLFPMYVKVNAVSNIAIVPAHVARERRNKEEKEEK